MSLISDALNKAQRDRAERELARSSVRVTPRKLPRPPLATAARPILARAGVAALALLIAAGAFFYLRPSPTTPEPQRVANVPAPLPPAPRAVPVSPAASPFKPPTATTPLSGARPPDYDLVGTTTLGKDTLLGISRRRDKHSAWIPVGKTVGEITAVSYDSASDRAVIRVDGQLLTLAMNGGAPDGEAPPAE